MGCAFKYQGYCGVRVRVGPGLGNCAPYFLRIFGWSYVSGYKDLGYLGNVWSFCVSVGVSAYLGNVRGGVTDLGYTYQGYCGVRVRWG